MSKLLANTGCVIAVLYNLFISFRVVDDWLGIVAALLAVLLFPITIMVLPLVMFFIPSSAAGPLSLWPGIVVIGLLYSFSSFNR